MKTALFLPELFLLLSALVLFVLSLGKTAPRTARSITTSLAVINALLCFLSLGNQGELFFAAYRIDQFSQLFKLLIMSAFAFLLLFTTELKGIREDVKTEYYLFMQLSVLGLVMLVSSVELLSIVVALELSSFALYVLVPMRTERAGLHIQMEAGIKYILFGVVATGIMLFGMSYLFGLTGTTYLHELIPSIAAIGATPAVIVGVLMVMGGFFFKLGIFPFHFWLPDVYQGASNETTTFIASVPKLGAVALLIRVAMLAPADNGLSTLLAILAICSMFYGNLSALVQKDIKRMLGFSGIAHAGFVLLGILTLQETGYAFAMYYITGYVIMNLACFMVICTVSSDGENVEINDLTGLYKRSPLLAITLTVSMFALAGIPPFVGFMGKFMLLTNALENGYLPFVIMAALNTAIAIYYYLSVVRIAYCTPADDDTRSGLDVSLSTSMAGIALMVLIVMLGVIPEQIVDIARTAVQSIM